MPFLQNPVRTFLLYTHQLSNQYFIKLFFVLNVIFSINIFAQGFDIPLAEEVWSEPVRVDSFSLPARWGLGCSLTQSMDTIYFLSTGGYFYTSVFENNIWSTPEKLNSYINNPSPIRNSVISKDGKRLYFSKWGGYGSWDIYCSYLDSSTNDWGPAVNLGPNINSYDGEYYAYELSPDTLYCINNRWAPMGVCIYVKDSLTNDWEIIDSSNYQHPFGGGDIWGLSVTADKRKAYFSRYISADHTGDSLQSQLYVTYWDTLNNRWGNVYELNINSKAYEVKVDSNWSYWTGGADQYPWISPDGRTLYFISNRDAAREDSNNTRPDIYISHLLVDDKGDTVTGVENNANSDNLNFKLFLLIPIHSILKRI